MNLGCIIENVYLCHSGTWKCSVSSFLTGDVGYNKELGASVKRKQLFLVDRGNNYKPN